MKTLINICLSALLIVLATACGKDNYDAPGVRFAGKVTYNGQAVGVRGSNKSVYLQFWQDGYALKTSFNVYINQDGTYSAQLFKGTYKLVSTSGNGPWVSKQDTVIVTVNGNTSLDYAVTPYYTISNISYTLSGNILKASFDVTGVDVSRNIEYVALMVNKTQYVDFGTTVNKIEKTGVAPGRVELELDITNNLAAEKAIYARVGLKIRDVGEGVYDTEVKRLK